VSRALLVAGLVVGAALRVYPLHRPFIHPDQELQPGFALGAFARGDWQPGQLVYPSGYLGLLRTTYAAAYAVERATGTVGDRIDVLVRFVAAPFPFLVAARAWSCLAGVLTLWLAGRCAELLFGAPASGLAALLLATATLAVRESHYGSVDASATALFVATLLAVLRYVERPRAATMAWAGLLAGLTAGFRYQLAVVALAVPVAALAAAPPAGGSRRAAGARACVVAAVAALVAFALASPHSLLEASRAWREVHGQLERSYDGGGPRSLSLGALLALANGHQACWLAPIGLAAALRRRGRLAAPLLAATVPYAAALALSPHLFARYTLPLAPLVATLGAGGACVVAGALPGRARHAAALGLVALALVDPSTRSVELDRLLATTDTRDAAAQWLAVHVHAGEPVCLEYATGYAYPTQPIPPIVEAIFFGPDAARAVDARASRPRFTCDAAARGRWVVTGTHPALATFASTPPPVAAFLRAHGRLEARFTSLPDDTPADATVFDPIDANFLPLRGLGRVRAPGPNLDVWWVEGPWVPQPG
jgi:hypothetical protein